MMVAGALNLSLPPFMRVHSYHHYHHHHFSFLFPKSVRTCKLINQTRGNGAALFRKASETDEYEKKKEERPPFDLNLAVVLAGFAFEAYSSPPDNLGPREIDAAECQTVFLSETFLREIYDGQLFIKLKKGIDFPAMDPWGTSDPYVVIQFGSQVVKSKIKWATKEPSWNEDLTVQMKRPPTKDLQIAAWDANLVTPHKRMGNAAVSLESLCDGELHEVQVELGGMGGGGKIHLEVKYKSFAEIDEEKQRWRIPFVLDFLKANNFESALKMVFGSESVQARQFVWSAFGHLQSFGSNYLPKNLFSEIDNHDDTTIARKTLNGQGESNRHPLQEKGLPESSDNLGPIKGNTIPNFESDNNVSEIEGSSSLDRRLEESKRADDYFWKKFTELINRKVDGFVFQKTGFPILENMRWDGIDLLNRMGLQFRRAAEVKYIESGLATPEGVYDTAIEPSTTVQEVQASPIDIMKASQDALRQMDTILGGLVVLTSAFSQQREEAQPDGKVETKGDPSRMDVYGIPQNNVNEKVQALDQSLDEEMKVLFSTAESAMEAWAMLAISLGRPSFIKSEFEKICFLDNVSTDTQVAIWRDSEQKRLVVAFRGTEQARWKDLRTDLMLVPTGLNPERMGGDFKQEVQVHSGFLNAYDSVRSRIITLLQASIGFVEDNVENLSSWHVYVTGHSLGGALASLLALELSSSQMSKHGVISITMYNFGSPRVGNKIFAEVYNELAQFRGKIERFGDLTT